MKALGDSRILIVDDVKANVDVLVHALRDEYKLAVALDGESALRSVEKTVPDLVLLDIMMPGIDGYEVCRRLRASEATREVPVMFLSALEDVANKTMGFEVGGNDYLTKPFEMLEVKARVRSLLKAKLYADAVREAAARDLRIAREIQMGILPADLASSTRGTAARGRTRPSSRRARSAAISTRCCVPPTTASSWRSATCRARAFRPSLFMAVAITVLRTLARDLTDPAEILRRLSDELADRNPRGMFVTIQCLVFDFAAGRVSIAGAGHHELAILSPGQAPRLAYPSTGLPAGLMPGNSIQSESIAAVAGGHVRAVLRRRERGHERRRRLLRRGAARRHAGAPRRGAGRRRSWTP